MAVQTPSYWAEERYQPLIEVETAYGNKVKIPESFQTCWEEIKTMAQKAQNLSQQAKVDSLEYIKDTLESMIQKRGKIAADFGRVMLEIYEK